METIQSEFGLFPAPEKAKSIGLYLAHRPGLQLTADFSWVKVNGKIVRDDLRHFDLPGQQGWYVNLGLFGEGQAIQLEWELRSKTVPPETRVTLGVFRNNNVRDRIELSKNLLLEPFQAYPGGGAFSV